MSPVRSVVTLSAAVVAAAIMVSGCSNGADGSKPAAKAAAASGATPSASASDGMAGMDMTQNSALAWGPAPKNGVDSALRLEALLGQHSVLVADMMRARIRGDGDLAQSANAALTDNTQAMATVLQPVAGAAGAKQFSGLWSEHIRDLFNSAGALSQQDKAAQKSTLKELTAYETQLAKFFTAASGGRLKQKDAVAAVKEHISMLVDGADAFAEKDYPQSAALYRQSYEHTFGLGTTLAETLLPASVGKQLSQPEVQLRTSLTEVLGEHVALVIAAMRAAAGDQADFTAMGKQLNVNTLNLTKAIDSLFGSKAATGFQQYWSDHVDNLMTYTSAAIKGDSETERSARVQLRGFETNFGNFMNTATENRLGAKALVQAFVAHDRELLAEVDAYAGKNYQEAQNISYQTYTDMFTVSGELAGAIGQTLAGKLPKGGSQTGGGGMAHVLH
jgi:hypothetical protein